MKPKRVFPAATLLLVIASSGGFAQFFPPQPSVMGPPTVMGRPSVMGGFGSNPVLLPATVVAQSSTAPFPATPMALVPFSPIQFSPSPIASGNFLRRQSAPFNTSFGGFFSGYPFYSGYDYPAFNPTVNVNLSVPRLDPEYTPMYRVNPLYGVSPVPPVSTTTARFVLQVPDDAEVLLNGEKTSQKGTRRVYESPKLTGGKPFDFAVKIAWSENGKRMEEEKKVSLGAGESRTLIILANTGK
jgi:uncharacterized protein (TIGR03000 family)